jgi:hypothetical protein
MLRKAPHISFREKLFEKKKIEKKIRNGRKG